MIIQKEKFTLRSWKIDDFISLAENANNKKIWDNVRDYFPCPYTKKDAMNFIESALKNPLDGNVPLKLTEKLSEESDSSGT